MSRFSAEGRTAYPAGNKSCYWSSRSFGASVSGRLQYICSTTDSMHQEPPPQCDDSVDAPKHNKILCWVVSHFGAAV